MKYTIFSGCLIQTRFPEYEKATRLILNELSLKFEFIDTFSCCGSQIVESIDESLLYLIAGRNLAIAEQRGIDVILTLCGSCTYILKKTRLKLQDEMIRRKINSKLSKIDLTITHPVQVKHLAEFLNETPIIQRLKSKLKNKIYLKVALQNPCMLYRPQRISQIPPTETSLIIRLLRECGMDIVYHEFQDKCCGGTILAFNNNIGEPLVKKRYEAVNKLNTDLFIVGCPNCQLVYNIFPSILDSKMPPSIFFPQLLGLAVGYSLQDVGLSRNIDFEKIKKILKNLPQS